MARDFGGIETNAEWIRALKIIEMISTVTKKQYEQNLSHMFDIEENPVVNTKMAMSYSEER